LFVALNKAPIAAAAAAAAASTNEVNKKHYATSKCHLTDVKLSERQ
jgi:hypothetical protein